MKDILICQENWYDNCLEHCFCTFNVSNFQCRGLLIHLYCVINGIRYNKFTTIFKLNLYKKH